MKHCQVTAPAAQKLKAGRRLLEAQDFKMPLPSDGQCVALYRKQDFLGQALLARHKQGLGWLYTEQTVPLDQAYFNKSLHQAVSFRQKLFADPLTNAFRLYNGDGDGLGGFTIDRYGSYAVIQWYSQVLYNYRAQIISALKTAWPACQGVIGKNRFQTGSRSLPVSELLAGEEPPEAFTILENGVTYVVRLNEHWMTGIFLDQRSVRQYVQTELAPGRRVCNTFSYTGAFSVAAAMGGALATVSVDVANRTQALTEEQFQANGLSLEPHVIRVMDTFSYFRWAKRHDKHFDLVIMDPPSFARHKKGIFKATQDYRALAQEACAILAKQGYFLASTNAAQYDRARFKADIEGAMQASGRSYRLAQEFSLPADFPTPAASPESDYLKVFIYQVA